MRFQALIIANRDGELDQLFLGKLAAYLFVHVIRHAGLQHQCHATVEANAARSRSV